MPLDPWIIKTWPAWLWISTPFKFFLYFINRLLTATGLAYNWKRLRARRFFWVWLVVINGCSLGILFLFFYWLHARHS